MPESARAVRPLAAAALLAGAATLAWFAVREAALRTLPPTSPVVTALAGGDPRLVLHQAIVRLATTLQPPDPASYARILHAADRAPLAAEPFLFAALRATRDGDNPRSTHLLEEARRREPREPLIRVLLIDRYVRVGRPARAVAEMGSLARLMPDSAVISALVTIAMWPAAREPIRSVMAADPLLANRLLMGLAERGEPPGRLLQLADGIPARAPPGGPSWRERLLQQMVARGDVVRAYRLWQSFEGSSAGTALVADGRFRQGPGAGPFGWVVPANAPGAIDRQPNGGLTVTYYGRQPGPLLEQWLTLSPGVYRLASAAAEQPAGGNPSALAWRLTCAAGDRLLLLQPLAPGQSQPAASFAVPPGCPAQTLALEGRHGDYPSDTVRTIDRVGIAPDHGAR